MILQHKFALFQPLYRVLAELRSLGLNLSAGTVTGGLQQLLPLFQPLYEALVEYNRNADHWHADETRWLVFLRRPDKANFIWNMWVFAAARSIVYVLDPTRATTCRKTTSATTRAFSMSIATALTKPCGK